MSLSQSVSKYEALLRSFVDEWDGVQTARCKDITLQHKRCKRKTNLIYRCWCTVHGIKNVGFTV